MRMHLTEFCPLSDRSDPAVGSAPVESLTVVAQQDGTLASFADGEVDGASGAWHQRYEGRLFALAGDPQYPVTSFEGHVFDVGLTGLADPQTVRTRVARLARRGRGRTARR